MLPPIYPRLLQRAATAAILRAPAASKVSVFKLVRRMLRVAGLLERPVLCHTMCGARMLCNSRDFIQRRILFFGVWEPHLAAVLRTLVPPGGCAVDIGANIGYDSLLLAHLVGPTGRVVAIEANPAAVAALRHNLALNDAVHVRVIDQAVAAETGTRAIYELDADNVGMATLFGARGGRRIADVRAAPLADLLDADERATVVLVKMDIEGAEAEVLPQILDRLDAYPALRHVVVEMSGEDDGTMFARFLAAGFSAQCVTNDYVMTEYLSEVRDAGLAPLHAAPPYQADILFTRALS